MKKFSVAVKSQLCDYSEVEDLWISCNDCSIEKLFQSTSKHRVLIGFGESSKDLNVSTEEEALKSFGQLKTGRIGGLGAILADSKNGRLWLAPTQKAVWVLFKRSEMRCAVVEEELIAEKMDLGDALIGFSRDFSAEHLKMIEDWVLESESISYCLQNQISDFFEEKNISARALFLLDYSGKESYHFQIKSSLNAVSLTIDMIKNKVLKYHYEKNWKIETALHEALVNAITYGNRLDVELPVYICYELGNRCLRIWVRDNGKGFKVEEVRVPIGLQALEQISGRGIYIMKKFSEALFFNKQGNELVLCFDFAID